MKKHVFLILFIISLLCSCKELLNTNNSIAKVTFDKERINEILKSFMVVNNREASRSIQGYSSAILKVLCNSTGYSETKTIDVSSIDNTINIIFENLKIGSKVTISAELIVQSGTEDLVIYKGSTTQELMLSENDIKLVMLRNAFAVSFNANGGIGTMDNQVFEKEVPKAIQSNSFIKEDYVFSGWATEPDSSTVIYKNEEIYTIGNEDIVLYAVWRPLSAYTVTLDANGGEGEMDSFIAKESTPITLPLCTFKKDGYTFIGWATQSDSTEVVYTDGADFTIGDEDITLYALWIAGSGIGYKVEHYQQNIENDEYTIVSADTQSLTGVTDQDVAYNNKTYSGFTYNSSLTSINGELQTTGTINGDESTVVKLYYDRDIIEITLDLDGGTGTELLSGKYGATVSTIDEPIKTGHSFKGWDEVGGTLPVEFPPDNTTYTANWTANTYLIMFDSNGGSNSMEDQEVTYNDPISLSINEFTKSGYTFIGWATQSDSTEVVYTDGADFTIGDQNITLYALWIAGSGTGYKVEHYQQNIENNEYTIVSADTQSLTGVTDQDVAYNNKTYSGFTYNSSLTSINGELQTTGTINGEGSTVVKLYYDRDIIEITLDLDGGTGTESLSGKYGATVSTIEEPTKTGYTFKGWNEVGGILPTTYPTEDSKYIAQWTANTYTITYKDSGEATFSGSTTGLPTTHTYGTSIALVTPTKTGYTFDGWYTTSDCTGTAIEALGATDYTANITLYAKWTANTYTITYKDPGDATFTGIMSGQLTTHTYGTSIALVTPTKIGYTFDGWYTTSDCTGTAIEALGATDYTANIILYAQWTANTYTITYKDPGDATFTGITEDLPTTHTYNKETTLVVAERNDYTFGGWYTNTDCTGTAIEVLGAIDHTADITLYAKWIYVCDEDKVCEYLGSLGSGKFFVKVEGTISSNMENLQTALHGISQDTALIYLDLSEVTDLISIGDSILYKNYSLWGVALPASLETITETSLESCFSLESIKVSESSTYFKAEDDVLFSKDGKILYRYPAAKDAQAYTIPTDVTSIATYAFGYSLITEVVLPSGLTTLSTGAFYGCGNLTSISGGNLTTLGSQTFSGCRSLVITSNSDVFSDVTSVGTQCFYFCSSITGLTFPESLDTVNGYAFYGCSSLQSITCGSATVSIGCFDFSESNFETIASNTFYGCTSLTSIKFPTTLKSIGETLFNGCSSLTSIEFSDSSSAWTITDASSVSTSGILLDDETLNVTYFIETYKDCTWTKE